MNQAELILFLVQIWGGIGILVAILFLTFGIDQIDEDARGAYVFRLLLVPGVLLIWPFVLWRWFVLMTDRDNWSKRHLPPRKSHRWFGVMLPLAVFVIIVAGMAVRQTWPSDITPVQIAAPQEETQ